MEKSRTNKGINRLSLSLYLNYIAHGFALLIVAQNMTALSAASDIMQAALVAFMRLYPQHRGLVTGIFSSLVQLLHLRFQLLRVSFPLILLA